MFVLIKENLFALPMSSNPVRPEFFFFFLGGEGGFAIAYIAITTATIISSFKMLTVFNVRFQCSFSKHRAQELLSEVNYAPET